MKRPGIEPMGKHAYLILAHKNFGQLRKLIELLDHPLNDIFVHVDAKAADFHEEEWRDATRHSNLRFLPERISVNWGGVSIVNAEMSLLKSATSAGRYDYYHLLSGMDLPVKSQEVIHDFFDANRGKEFLNLWKPDGAINRRFRYYTVFPEGDRDFWKHLVNRVFKRMQRGVGFKINRGIELGYGSQWFSITDAFARYAVEKEEWVAKVFRNTILCDELFLPTLLAGSPFKGNLYNPEVTSGPKDVNLSNMRLIDWTRGGDRCHPWTFRAEDEELLGKTENLWARKFDETVDAEIIERIYNKLKGK